ncbi:glycosyltransferase family 2 protein [Candidatus Micrarchaeota archaeon]|nr:glycosyltransferase family 2 protein [Candidatus Micrarchaeota archaeon]
MKNIKEKISIVIPTLNEEKNLPILFSNLRKSLNGRRYEIIIADGYSTDRTIEIAKRYGAKVLFDNKGKGSAIKKGVSSARYDTVVIMDADCSNLPDEMVSLIKTINNGYDICMGSRFTNGGFSEDISWYRKIGNKFFIHLVNFFWKTNYTDLCYGYRCFAKSSFEKLHLKSDGFGIETELSIKVAKKKLKFIEIPSFEKKRRYGEGKLKTMKHGFEILMVILNELLTN